MSVALDALIEISHLLGAPIGNYYPAEIRVDIYEERVQAVSRLIRRVILAGSSVATPLPPSSLGH